MDRVSELKLEKWSDVFEYGVLAQDKWGELWLESVHEEEREDGGGREWGRRCDKL